MSKIIKDQFSKFSFLFVALFLIVTVKSLQNLINFTPPKITAEKSSINFDKKIFKIFNLGQKRAISSVLWFNTLLNADLIKHKDSDFKSWIYLRFDLITDLDPMFKEAYYFGSQYLSVITDDKFGAKALFDKGLKFFPHDFGLNFYGGIHDYLELGDYQSALKRFKVIENSYEAPPNIKSLIQKLKKLAHTKETKYLILLEALNNLPPNSPLRDEYLRKIKELKFSKIH